jgi:hypothetical protein
MIIVAFAIAEEAAAVEAVPIAGVVAAVEAAPIVEEPEVASIQLAEVAVPAAAAAPIVVEATKEASSDHPGIAGAAAVD